MTKTGTGRILHFAVACTTCTLRNGEMADNQIVAWPIPTTIQVNITTSKFAGQPVSLSVTDVNSKRLMQKAFTATQTYTLDVYQLSAGAYILILETSDKVLKRKFTK